MRIQRFAPHTGIRIRAIVPTIVVAAGLVNAGCIRWGIPEDEMIGDDTDDPTSSEPPLETESSGDETTDTGEEFVWPESWPLGPGARVVVWGKTGIPTRNLAMIENALVDLAGDGDPNPGSMNILWIDDCDPREDPAGCLAGNVQPFFDMVATLGSIEFKPLSLVDPLAYDVVVADFCGPVSVEQVATMLGDGAHVLVLGDYWCESPSGISAELANGLLEHFGTRFDGDVLYNHEFLVADQKQVGLLEGVSVVDAWGVALQVHTEPFESALGTFDGALITSRSE